MTRDGEKARLFGPDAGAVEGKAFADRCADDRHHFRFIVSPDDALEMSDLKSFTRDLVLQMEKDLGSPLEWAAVDHWNTEHPHVHLIVRGVRDDGQDLVIARDYIKAGMRDRARDLITQELGPRTDLDIRRTLEQQIVADRWTQLDRQLVRDGDRSGIIDVAPVPGGEPDPFQTFKIGRLRKLEALGLAVQVGHGQWTIDDKAAFDDARGVRRVALAVRSDLDLERQITAPGATWLDRHAIARKPSAMSDSGFGAEVRDALDRRAEYLVNRGPAERRGSQVSFSRNLLDTVRRQELAALGDKLAAETGKPFHRAGSGEYVAGSYRQRLTLASGRFAMLDDGLGFQLVPWTPALEKHLGRHVSGVVRNDGGIDWSFARKRGLGL